MDMIQVGSFILLVLAFGTLVFMDVVAHMALTPERFPMKVTQEPSLDELRNRLYL